METEDLQTRVDALRAKAPAEPVRDTGGLLADLEHVPGHTLADRRMVAWRVAIPSRFQAAELDQLGDQPEAVRGALAEWSQRPNGRNVVLLGAVGVGKTHAAVAACRAQHFEHGRDVAFMPVVELLDQLRPGGPEGTLGRLSYVDLLIMDDLGAEKPTDWTGERLYSLVNRRWMEQLPTVVTANLGADQLKPQLGERLFSRLVGDGAVVAGLTGPDRRQRRG